MVTADDAGGPGARGHQGAWGMVILEIHWHCMKGLMGLMGLMWVNGGLNDFWGGRNSGCR